jgi:uncharacterized membrane protein
MKPANLFGHPIHQMVIVFPLGLLATAVVFDMIRAGTHQTIWSVTAYFMIGAGVISGLVAALFGLIDFLAVPERTRAKAYGLWHGLGNVAVLILFAASWWLRQSNPATPSQLAIGLSLVGLVVVLVTGWLGGELVDRFGMGVQPGANPNAPGANAGKEATQGSHR